MLVGYRFQVFRMINQLILAGSDYFSNAAKPDSVEPNISTDKPTQTEILIQKLLSGDMSVQNVPPDVNLQLLQTLEEKLSMPIKTESKYHVQTVFAND